jgi:hypothetical protein
LTEPRAAPDPPGFEPVDLIAQLDIIQCFTQCGLLFRDVWIVLHRLLDEFIELG